MRPGPRPERRDRHDVAAAAAATLHPWRGRNARQISDGSAEMFRARGAPSARRAWGKVIPPLQAEGYEVFAAIVSAAIIRVAEVAPPATDSDRCGNRGWLSTIASWRPSSFA